MKQDIREYLSETKLITDGAFGTYFGMLHPGGMFPERANVQAPEAVLAVHEAYLRQGATLLRTNTFASNTQMLGVSLPEVLENVRAGFSLAKKAADGHAFVAGDIGPIRAGMHEKEEELKEEYLAIAREFIRLGADAIVFETFSETQPVLSVMEELRKESDVFLWLQFSVNQLGYSNAGISAKTLFREAAACDALDAVGLNCGVGPGHMKHILDGLDLAIGKYVSALPNAGYPKRIQDRVVFSENIEYFAQRMAEMLQAGVSIVGGCCGTNPQYIRALAGVVTGSRLIMQGQRRQKMEAAENAQKSDTSRQPVRDRSFLARIRESGAGSDQPVKAKAQKAEKLIVVELSPPPSAQDEKLMEAAHILKELAVDAVTFPDSPSGRTRADSVLMAAKVAGETGLCVVPHICCRDKNAIAMRSQLLGAYLSDIRNLLIITGDPVPTMMRSDIKSVFQFDSVGLMRLVHEMNKDSFSQEPMHYGGAINQNRHNLDVEITRVKKKMEAGAEFFLTQPVFTQKEAENIRSIQAQTGAVVLCGIMPLVSYKNALFIQNEMSGMNVTDEVVARYKPDGSREEGEAAGIALATDMIAITSDFTDGYYFSIPFNRVSMLVPILAHIREKE